jgi:two-component system, chemotaxis family, chemotaxis protein CheY
MTTSIADSPPQAAAKATVLIADDAPAVRAVCRVLLAEHGYHVIEAEDGQEAVALYAACRPHVTLLDINMPRLDGLGALARIRELDPHAHVVMLTAKPERDKVLAAIRAGAQDFVAKPFQVKRVLDAIEKLLSLQAAQ